MSFHFPSVRLPSIKSLTQRMIKPELDEQGNFKSWKKSAMLPSLKGSAAEASTQQQVSKDLYGNRIITNHPRYATNTVAFKSETIRDALISQGRNDLLEHLPPKTFIKVPPGSDRTYHPFGEGVGFSMYPRYSQLDEYPSSMGQPKEALLTPIAGYTPLRLHVFPNGPVTDGIIGHRSVFAKPDPDGMFFITTKDNKKCLPITLSKQGIQTNGDMVDLRCHLDGTFTDPRSGRRLDSNGYLLPISPDSRSHPERHFDPHPPLADPFPDLVNPDSRPDGYVEHNPPPPYNPYPYSPLSTSHVTQDPQNSRLTEGTNHPAPLFSIEERPPAYD